MPPEVLDLTLLATNAEAAATRDALDGLAPGQAVIVITRSRPAALLKQLIAERWGAFDWAPLSERKGAWRSEMRRRSAPAPVALKDFLAADHARCDSLYSLAEDTAQAGDLDATRERFESFTLGMGRHFAMEEEGFFAELDARAGFSGDGPTEMMRQEHRQMRGLLDQMAGELSEGNLQRFLSAGETLLILMEQHNMKEEQMLYEMADELLGNEVEATIKRLLLL
jgi:uncharacterized protein (DUF2249 family)